MLRFEIYCTSFSIERQEIHQFLVSGFREGKEKEGWRDGCLQKSKGFLWTEISLDLLKEAHISSQIKGEFKGVQQQIKAATKFVETHCDSGGGKVTWPVPLRSSMAPIPKLQHSHLLHRDSFLQFGTLINNQKPSREVAENHPQK